MDYAGKKVLHKSFGEGRVVGEDEKGYLFVQFQGQMQLKKFSAPSCFQTFLKLCDPDGASSPQEVLPVRIGKPKRPVIKKRETEEKTAKLEKVPGEVKEPSKEMGEAPDPPKKMIRERIKTTSPRSAARGKEGGGAVSSGKAASAVEAGDKAGSENETGAADTGEGGFRGRDLEYLDEQEGLLRGEIGYLKSNGGKRIRLMEGKLVGQQGEKFIYIFEAGSKLSIPDNTQISLWLFSKSKEGVSAMFIGSEDFTVLISTMAFLGQSLSSVEISPQPWHLLECLVERFQALRKDPSPIVRSLVGEGRGKILPKTEMKVGQETACRMSITQPITFVWGPPGTGKTETLANIAIQHMKKGLRVLMLSYSNVSVDGATLRVFEKEAKKEAGRLLRYGYPKDTTILEHEYLSSYNLALRNNPELQEERTRLMEERKKVPRNSEAYVEMGKRLAQIRTSLEEAEKKLVGEASFVATTVSKAVADPIFAPSCFDTVIFDEASMALTAEIFFSAFLAKEHFVCMGDFNQLPPIVESSSTSSLNADIFYHCGIVEAVQEGAGHEWLCMLNIQYRMHPEIAEFSSRSMYQSLLKSHESMLSKRQGIAGSAPFSGQALHLADVSKMLSVCTITREWSRINLLSAILSVGLAINAAKGHDVGIITPYGAQSRLLHALAQDAAEADANLHRISCATVHQFQGSEKDVIIYDAVDSYRAPRLGVLLTGTSFNRANRLYNVALTRARGKMICVVNVDYMKSNGLPSHLMFRQMIDSLLEQSKASRLEELTRAASSEFCKEYTFYEATERFIADLNLAKKEVVMDFPGKAVIAQPFLGLLVAAIRNAKKRGVQVVLRARIVDFLPEGLRKFSMANQYISNPVTLIDRELVWYGMPTSMSEFHVQGTRLPLSYQPRIRIEGRQSAQAIYDLLGMYKKESAGNRKLTESEDMDGRVSFASFVKKEVICPDCGSFMRLKMSGRGSFFLGCGNYPRCKHTEPVQLDLVNAYFQSRGGVCCPVDHAPLEAKEGRYGVQVYCLGEPRHFYQLDEV